MVGKKSKSPQFSYHWREHYSNLTFVNKNKGMLPLKYVRNHFETILELQLKWKISIIYNSDKFAD